MPFRNVVAQSGSVSSRLAGWANEASDRRLVAMNSTRMKRMYRIDGFFRLTRLEQSKVRQGSILGFEHP